MDVAQAPGTRRAPTSELCDALHLRVETLLEQLFFTTLYIETSYADGRKASGTGFVYNVHVGGGQYATFMVTNKHVIEGAETARLRFVACEDDTMSAPLLGQAHHIDIQAPGTLFTGHPTGDVDVAVLPISPGVSRLKEHGQFVFFRAVTSAVSMDDASVQTLDAMEEVTFLGYPNGLYDQVNFLPIARRGHTATPPAVDYGGQPVFLVDASVFPGSSGSPVFLAQTGTYSIRNTGAYVGQRVMLLGVLAAVYQRTVPVLQVPTATASFVRDAIDIGIVYKARTINEAVDVALAPHSLKRSSEEPPDQVAQPSASQDPLSEQ